MLVKVYERINNKKVLIDVDFYSIASIKKMQMSGYLVENLTKQKKAETPFSFYMIDANIRSGPKHYTIREAWLSREKFKKIKNFYFPIIEHLCGQLQLTEHLFTLLH